MHIFSSFNKTGPCLCMLPFLVLWNESGVDPRDVLELNLALFVVGPINDFLGVVEHGS